MFDDVKKEPEDIFAKTDEVSPKPKSPTTQPVTQNTQSAPNVKVQQAQSEVPVQKTADKPQPVIHTPPTKKPENIQERVEALNAKKGRFPIKAIIIVIAIILIVGVAFFISMRILKSRTPNTPIAPAGNQLDTILNKESMPEPSPSVKVPESTAVPAPVVVPEPTPEPTPEPDPVIEIDSDKDGLDDSTEKLLGTNPNNPDSDNDGLQDREEVEVYKTNPLEEDSDNDGYLDGAEIKAGYNPLGEGKLFKIPTNE